MLHHIIFEGDVRIRGCRLFKEGAIVKVVSLFKDTVHLRVVYIRGGVYFRRSRLYTEGAGYPLTYIYISSMKLDDYMYTKHQYIYIYI